MTDKLSSITSLLTELCQEKDKLTEDNNKLREELIGAKETIKQLRRVKLILNKKLKPV
jgi:hypothetical protein